MIVEVKNLTKIIPLALVEYEVITTDSAPADNLICNVSSVSCKGPFTPAIFVALSNAIFVTSVNEQRLLCDSSGIFIAIFQK